jgi:S1-C subfamily serine protease
MVLIALIALGLALGVGVVVGGGAVYALTRGGDRLPLAVAQGGDPGYGIVIVSVTPEGPAGVAGVTRGDILLEIDGQILEDQADLHAFLQDAAPGDEVELTVLHGDEQRALMVTLDERNDRAYLGLSPCGVPRRAVERHLGAPGAHIVEVVPDSLAEAAGLEKGDVILSVDGQEVDDEHGLADLIAAREPGDTVTLEVTRPGEASREIAVELGPHPDDKEAGYLGVRYAPFPHVDMWRGAPPHLEEFRFDELPFDLPEGALQGTIVQQVTEDSPASAAGLQEGDVIAALDGEPVEGPRALVEAIAERAPGDQITLTVFRPDDEGEREIEVTLGAHPEDEDKAYLGVTIGGDFYMRHKNEGEAPYRFRFFRRPFEFDFEGELPQRFEFALPSDSA